MFVVGREPQMKNENFNINVALFKTRESITWKCLLILNRNEFLFIQLLSAHCEG